MGLPDFSSKKSSKGSARDNVRDTLEHLKAAEEACEAFKRELQVKGHFAPRTSFKHPYVEVKWQGGVVAWQLCPCQVRAKVQAGIRVDDFSWANGLGAKTGGTGKYSSGE